MLRRVAQAILAKDWLTFLVEIVVVVVGIYLGIQASAWDRDRNDREDEISYLERISADLETSIGITLADVDFQKRHAEYGALILDSLSECRLQTGQRDEFASGIYLAGKYISASFVKASIDELLSSGRTTIIRNASLRQRIIELMAIHEEHIFYMSDVQLRATPHVNYIDGVAPIVVTEPIGGGANVGWGRLRAELVDLCKDKRFFSAIAATMNYTWDSTAALIGWADKLSTLNRDIESELVGLRSSE
jgi:hypothetical protein